MTVNRASVEAVFEGLKAEFNNAVAMAKTTWPMVAMRTESSTNLEQYPWLEDFPAMREWLGDRVVTNPVAQQYTLRNKDYESTMSIDRNHIEDDRIGIYASRMQAAGAIAARWADGLVYAAVNSSFQSQCYDGKPLIADNHPLTGNPDFSNKIEISLSAESVDKAQKSYGAAVLMLQKMTNPEGEPLGLMPGVLLVPPDLKATADQIINSDTIAEIPNPYKGSAEVVMSPRLKDARKWWLIADDTIGFKPFIYQERKAPEIDLVMNPEDYHVFMQRQFLVGIHARGAAGYSLPAARNRLYRHNRPGVIAATALSGSQAAPGRTSGTDRGDGPRRLPGRSRAH